MSVFEGAIDDAIAQAKDQRDHGLAPQRYSADLRRDRAALLQHLGLLDQVRIGYTMPEHDPEPQYGVPETSLDARFAALSEEQFEVYWDAREVGNGVRDALRLAEMVQP